MFCRTVVAANSEAAGEAFLAGTKKNPRFLSRGFAAEDSGDYFTVALTALSHF